MFIVLEGVDGSGKSTQIANLQRMFAERGKRAVELGQRVVTSVEHGYQGNYLRCWEMCEQYGLKFVFGVEAYWVKDRHEPDDTNAHILILARNEAGRRQINKMLAEANKTGFYGKPRVDMELLRTLHPSDVFITTACVAFWGKPDRESGDVKWHYDSEDAMDALFAEMFAHFGEVKYFFYSSCLYIVKRWNRLSFNLGFTISLDIS